MAKNIANINIDIFKNIDKKSVCSNLYCNIYSDSNLYCIERVIK